MTLKISGKHMDIGESLTNHIQQQVIKINETYFHHDVRTNVVMSKSNVGFSCDITVNASHHLVVNVSDQDGDAYRCVDNAFQKLHTRLRRFRNRLTDRKRKAHDPIVDHMPAAQYVMQAPQENDQINDTPIVIAESQSELLTLTVSDAVMHMELSGQNVMMFKNAGNGKMNVVYLREDGNIGWIDPSLPL